MLVDVALPLPLPRTFAYSVPPGLASRALPGRRVRVPFRGTEKIGWIDRQAAGPGSGTIRPLSEVLDDDPSLPPRLFELCRWLSSYYLAPLGLVLRSALPAALSSPAAAARPPAPTRRVVSIVRELPALLERDRVFVRAPRQRECYEVLEGMGGTAELAHLTSRLGFSPSVPRALEQKGLARLHQVEVTRDPYAGVRTEEAALPGPTPAQGAVISALSRAAGAGGGTFLLRGVTGSGKTRVYLELLREVVDKRGKTAIVLVPEIALTPQTVQRFRAVFGDRVAVLHSGLSDGERYDEWRALQRGSKRIAVGARSAVFAPLPDLGAIVVDEEHEPSYKQNEVPRYHAREAAIVRARLESAVCVLGSATPSLESWENARQGKFTLLELPERVAGGSLPPVRVLDLRRERRKAGSHGRARPLILSLPLQRAVEQRLARGEQTLLLLNRRGFSNFVQCRACGRVHPCPNCNVSLTFHRGRSRVVCHHCGHQEPVPGVCPECASEDLSFRGVGTEQVERAVGEAFPAARVSRMDLDTTSGKWAHQRILERVGRGETDILLGTQMIAKGLDFPNVTLVGVINADVGLGLPDFRAAERTFQLLTQVAGRAGRGPKEGEVIVQTSLPDHPAIRLAASHDYTGFARRELAWRRDPPYPPFRRLLNLVVSGPDQMAVQEHAGEAAGWLAGLLRKAGPGVLLTGPAPCPLDRVRGRWRWHLLLRSRHAPVLERVGDYFYRSFVTAGRRPGIRFVLDRDPVSLL